MSADRDREVARRCRHGNDTGPFGGMAGQDRIVDRQASDQGASCRQNRNPRCLAGGAGQQRDSLVLLQKSVDNQGAEFVRGFRREPGMIRQLPATAQPPMRGGKTKQQQPATPRVGGWRFQPCQQIAMRTKRALPVGQVGAECEIRADQLMRPKYQSVEIGPRRCFQRITQRAQIGRIQRPAQPHLSVLAIEHRQIGARRGG